MQIGWESDYQRIAQYLFVQPRRAMNQDRNIAQQMFTDFWKTFVYVVTNQAEFVVEYWRYGRLPLRFARFAAASELVVSYVICSMLKLVYVSRLSTTVRFCDWELVSFGRGWMEVMVKGRSKLFELCDRYTFVLWPPQHVKRAEKVYRG